MSVLFGAMGYSSIYSEQEYTGFTETENRVLFTSLVKQEYTGYTATENLVFYISCEAGVHREDSN